jgi:hypothetical protein
LIGDVEPVDGRGVVSLGSLGHRAQSAERHASVHLPSARNRVQTATPMGDSQQV